MPRKAATPAPPRPSKGERTRDQLVETIVALVNERPLDDIRIADICAPHGLAAGAFYFHFKGKDDAFEAIGIEAVTRLYAPVLAAPPAADFFSECVEILTQFYRAAIERRSEVRAIFMILNARRHAGVRDAWLAVRRQLQQRLAARIAVERGTTGTGAFASANVTAHYLLCGLERFYDDVFFLTIDADLPAEAANFDVFVRQQARLWSVAATGPTQ
ncbi:hypothetical protein IP88_08505 [alpha proteobacterium AAP81b]|nr:hypothetical protein IP88_08505 [alpha proteobacterium AAP81b]